MTDKVPIGSLRQQRSCEPKRCCATPQRATAVDVDPANTGQASAWDGEEGGYWAAHAEQFDRAVAAYHERFLDSADIASGALVLDIGCGTGQATRDAARAANGTPACRRAGHR